jgi:hypothetical protein
MKTSKEDIIKVLKDVGFHEIAERGGVGYIIPFLSISDDIEVYLRKGYLNIHLTQAFINLEIYKADSFTYIHHGMGEVIPSSWYKVKLMRLRKNSESCMSEFRDFLLLSICRDSFLDPEEDKYTFRCRRGENIWDMDCDWF